MTEQDNQVRTREYYAQHADAYFQRTRDVDMSPVYGPFEGRLAAGSRIMDLGCGSGRDSRHFAESGHRVVALDPCRELLGLAASCTPQQLHEHIQFAVGGAPQLAFAGASFDAVWACASLLHLARSEMPPALAECRRVLRQGGLLFVAVKEGSGQLLEPERHFTLWTADELCGLISQAGFHILQAGTRASFEGRDVTWVDVLAEAV